MRCRRFASEFDSKYFSIASWQGVYCATETLTSHLSPLTSHISAKAEAHAHGAQNKEKEEEIVFEIERDFEQDEEQRHAQDNDQDNRGKQKNTCDGDQLCCIHSLSGRYLCLPCEHVSVSRLSELDSQWFSNQVIAEQL
jgi:hypothetical protein